MPTLEEILKQSENKGSINLVPSPDGTALTQEEIQELNKKLNEEKRKSDWKHIDDTDFSRFKTKEDQILNNLNIDGYVDPLMQIALQGSPNAYNNMLEQSLKATERPNEKQYLSEDKSDQLARYEFPVYADLENLSEQYAYSQQSNSEAIVKGAKNILPVAIGVGAQMLGGALQIVNNAIGDDDYNNPITEWGKDFMKRNMSPIYQPDKFSWKSSKDIIAGGSEIIGQFGSALGSMVAMSPINAGMVRSTATIGTALGGPLGGLIGGVAGTILAAATNAYAEGVIDASDIYEEKRKQILKETRNEEESRKIGKLAAQTVANQNMYLNTALNIIPVMWSIKPYGVDKYIKNTLGIDDVDNKWFRLQKRYIPEKLPNETFDDFVKRLDSIEAGGMITNTTYSLTSRPFETLKNLGKYSSQKWSNIKYNARHPLEYLNRNWDIVGETIGEGLEEYHNYFARTQGEKVFVESDASNIPSINKLMEGYKDMIVHGHGAYDLMAGSIIGGMSAPIMSSVRFGRTKIYNPETGEMEYKYKRPSILDPIPFEFNNDSDQKEYESYVTNGMQRIKDVRDITEQYLTTNDSQVRESMLNNLLGAPLTKYVDDGSIGIYNLAMKNMVDTISRMNLNDLNDQNTLNNIKTYLDHSEHALFDAALQSSNNTLIETFVKQANKRKDEHTSLLNKRIEFIDKQIENYRKMKTDIEANYGGQDYGYTATLFKNRMALEIEKDIKEKTKRNHSIAEENIKKAIKSLHNVTEDWAIDILLQKHLNDPNNSVDGKTIDQELINDYLNTKKADIESEFRLTKFQARFNSLSSWDYMNENDLRKELELIEELSNLNVTLEDLRSIANMDNDMQMQQYQDILDMKKQQLTLSPTDANLQQEILELEDYLNGYQTNSALQTYIELLSRQIELSQLMSKQVSNLEDFKTKKDYDYKGFNPLEKYLKRNKIYAEELKKLGKAKSDMDKINNKILPLYREYANLFADYLTPEEEENIFEKSVDDLQKLIYGKYLELNPQTIDKRKAWLKIHESKYREVIEKLQKMKEEENQIGMQNPFLVNYLSRLIQMINYQKDVVDQLYTLTFYENIKMVGLSINEIIEKLNDNTLTKEQAVDIIKNSKIIEAKHKQNLIKIIENIDALSSNDYKYEHEAITHKVFKNKSTNKITTLVKIVTKFTSGNSNITMEIIQYGNDDIIIDNNWEEITEQPFDISLANDLNYIFQAAINDIKVELKDDQKLSLSANIIIEKIIKDDIHPKDIEKILSYINNINKIELFTQENKSFISNVISFKNKSKADKRNYSVIEHKTNINDRHNVVNIDSTTGTILENPKIDDILINHFNDYKIHLLYDDSIKNFIFKSNRKEYIATLNDKIYFFDNPESYSTQDEFKKFIKDIKDIENLNNDEIDAKLKSTFNSYKFIIYNKEKNVFTLFEKNKEPLTIDLNHLINADSDLKKDIGNDNLHYLFKDSMLIGISMNQFTRINDNKPPIKETVENNLRNLLGLSENVPLPESAIDLENKTIKGSPLSDIQRNQALYYILGLKLLEHSNNHLFLAFEQLHNTVSIVKNDDLHTELKNKHNGNKIFFRETKSGILYDDVVSKIIDEETINTQQSNLQQVSETPEFVKIRKENDDLGKSILNELGYKKHNRLPNGNVAGGQDGWKIRLNIKNPKTNDSYYDKNDKKSLNRPIDEHYKKTAKILADFLNKYFDTHYDEKEFDKHEDGMYAFRKGVEQSIWKHRAGGDVGGADFTIYIGSADDVLKFISDVRTKHPEIINLLTFGNKGSDTQIDDVFKGRIEGSNIGFKGYELPSTMVGTFHGKELFNFVINGEEIKIKFEKGSIQNARILYKENGQRKGSDFSLYKQNYPDKAASLRNIIGFQLYGDYLTGSNNEFVRLTGVNIQDGKYDPQIHTQQSNQSTKLERLIPGNYYISGNDELQKDLIYFVYNGTIHSIDKQGNIVNTTLSPDTYTAIKSDDKHKDMLDKIVDKSLTVHTLSELSTDDNLSNDLTEQHQNKKSKDNKTKIRIIKENDIIRVIDNDSTDSLSEFRKKYEDRRYKKNDNEYYEYLNTLFYVDNDGDNDDDKKKQEEEDRIKKEIKRLQSIYSESIGDKKSALRNEIAVLLNNSEINNAEGNFLYDLIINKIITEDQAKEVKREYNNFSNENLIKEVNIRSFLSKKLEIEALGYKIDEDKRRLYFAGVTEETADKPHIKYNLTKNIDNLNNEPIYVRYKNHYIDIDELFDKNNLIYIFENIYMRSLYTDYLNIINYSLSEIIFNNLEDDTKNEFIDNFIQKVNKGNNYVVILKENDNRERFYLTSVTWLGGQKMNKGTIDNRVDIVKEGKVFMKIPTAKDKSNTYNNNDVKDLIFQGKLKIYEINSIQPNGNIYYKNNSWGFIVNAGSRLKPLFINGSLMSIKELTLTKNDEPIIYYLNKEDDSEKFYLFNEAGYFTRNIDHLFTFKFKDVDNRFSEYNTVDPFQFFFNDTPINKFINKFKQIKDKLANKPVNLIDLLNLLYDINQILSKFDLTKRFEKAFGNNEIKPQHFAMVYFDLIQYAIEQKINLNIDNGLIKVFVESDVANLMIDDKLINLELSKENLSGLITKTLYNKYKDEFTDKKDTIDTMIEIFNKIMIGFMQIDVDDIAQEDIENIDDSEAVNTNIEEYESSDILAEPAVSQKDRVKKKLPFAPISDFQLLGAEIIFSNPNQQKTKNRQSLLKGEVFKKGDKQNAKIKIETALVIYNNDEPKTYKTIQEWRSILTELFNSQMSNDNIANKKTFLQNQGLLELYSFLEISFDNDKLVIGDIQLKNGITRNELINALNLTNALTRVDKKDRYSLLETKINIESLLQNNNFINLMKELFIISNTPISVNAIDKTNEKFIGFLHSAKFITSQFSSISLHNEEIYNSSNETQLDKELNYIKESFTEKLNLYYKLNEIGEDETIVVNIDFRDDRPGRLNIIEQKEAIPTSIMIPNQNNQKFSQLVFGKYGNTRTFELKDSDGNTIDKLYNYLTVSSYLYAIIYPTLRKIHPDLNNEDLAEKLFTIININDNLSKEDNQSYQSVVYNYFAEKMKNEVNSNSNAILDAIESNILDKLKTNDPASDENKYYKNSISNNIFINLTNPMSKNNRVQLYVLPTLQFKDIDTIKTIDIQTLGIRDEDTIAIINDNITRSEIYKENIINDLITFFKKIKENLSVSDKTISATDFTILNNNQISISDLLRFFFGTSVTTLRENKSLSDNIITAKIRSSLKNKKETSQSFVFKNNVNSRLVIGLNTSSKLSNKSDEIDFIEITIDTNSVIHFTPLNKKSSFSKKSFDLNDNDKIVELKKYFKLLLSNVYLRTVFNPEYFKGNKSLNKIVQSITKTKIIGVDDLFYIHPIIKLESVNSNIPKEETIVENDSLNVYISINDLVDIVKKTRYKKIKKDAMTILLSTINTIKDKNIPKNIYDEIKSILGNNNITFDELKNAIQKAIDNVQEC